MSSKDLRMYDDPSSGYEPNSLTVNIGAGVNVVIAVNVYIAVAVGLAIATSIDVTMYEPK